MGMSSTPIITGVQLSSAIADELLQTGLTLFGHRAGPLDTLTNKCVTICSYWANKRDGVEGGGNLTLQIAG